MMHDENMLLDTLPPFANAENKALDAEIKAKQAKLNAVIAALEDNRTRSEAMLGHAKNVKQELSQTQALYDAKNREIETEDHFKQLAEREGGRLAIEMKKMENEIRDLTDQLSSLQSTIYSTTTKLDTVRTELKLEKEELDEWGKVQQEKDEDQMALLKYSKEDDIKIKELSLQIERLMVDVQKKKSQLSAEVTETQVAQIELDKTTEAFKKLHNERQELIDQWEAAVKEMAKKDAEIADAQDRFMKLKEEIRQRQLVIDEKQAFLNQQLENNQSAEKKMTEMERGLAKQKLEHQNQQHSLNAFHDELDVLRNTLNKVASDLSARRQEIGNLKNELSERQSRLEKEKFNRAEMKRKLNQVMDETLSKEQQAQALLELLKSEELRSKELDRELNMLKEQRFKKSQEVFKLKQEEKNVNAEIAGGEVTAKNFAVKIQKLDQESQKQQALLYAQEFNLQQLERKVRRAQGERSDEEREQLQAKIEELNKQLEEDTRKWNMLNQQMRKSMDDIRVAKRRLETLEKERNTVLTQIEELNLYTESAGIQLQSKIREKEELMVEENILRLELRKLRGFLHARADEVFSLENRQLSLQLALEERAKDISIHTDMLRMQHRQSEEERASAAAELRERVSKVERLKKRYEILMNQFKPEDGEEEHTQAYYVIKAAQRREELQHEGDELDGKIRKAEREIKALENTLKLMNTRNEAFRMDLYKAELDMRDVERKELLEQQYRAAMEKYKAKREEIQRLQATLSELEQSLSGLTETEASRLQTINALEKRLQVLDKEVTEQEQKRDRARTRMMKTMRETKKAKGIPLDQTSEEEVDLQIRTLKDYANAILSKIGEITEDSPEIGMKLQELYAQAGIQPPSRPLTRDHSRANSVLSGRDSIRMTSPSRMLNTSQLTQPGATSRASSRTSNSVPSRAPSRVSAINMTLPEMPAKALPKQKSLPRPLSASSTGSRRSSLSGH